MADSTTSSNTSHINHQTDLLSSYQEHMNDRIQAEKYERMQVIAKLQEQIQIEKKIKTGAETMLQVYETSKKGDTISREEVEMQLAAANQKITVLTKQMEMFAADASPSERKPSKPDTSQSPRTDNRKSPHTAAATTVPLKSSEASSPKLRKAEVELSKHFMNHLQELLNKVKNPQEAPNHRLDCMNSLLKAIKSLSEDESNSIMSLVVKGIRPCLVDAQKEMRANGFRFLRHIISGRKSIEIMFDAHIELFVIRALARDHRYEVEREQAVRLVRSFIDVPAAAEKIPQSIVRTLIAIAEQPDDKFRTVAMETLCELALSNPKMVALAGGLKIIIPALIDGPKELGETVLYTLIYMLDKEESRSYIRPMVEIEMILSHFTDVYGKGSSFEEKLMNCARAIIAFLRTWTGAIYFCADNKRAIRSLVESLRQPNEISRKILLDMLFEVFLVDMPKWYPEFVLSRMRAINTLPLFDELTEEQRQQLIHLYPNRKRMNLLDQYQTFLLVAFIEADLLEALMEVIQDSEKSVSMKAIVLMGDLREQCNRLLPESFNIKINSLSNLIQVAADFKDETKRHRATLAISNIDYLYSNKERFLLHAVDDQVAKRWLARSLASKVHTKAFKKTSKQCDELKIKIGLQMDDIHFKNLVNDVEIHIMKEYSKWNWDGIMELVNGPLQNPRRLDDAIKNTKFLRRILQFYRPSSRQFSDIKKSKTTEKYVKIGCEIIEMLLNNAEGVRCLIEAKVLQDIAECLAQLDPFTDQPEVVFSQNQLSRTLTADYFVLLGSLSKHAEGHRLLERCRIFTTFYHVSELRNRDDVIKLMLTTMDYNLDGHPRIILSKLLTSGSTEIRQFATNHVRLLIKSETVDIAQWGIQLLITQLYDPVASVAGRAADILDEAFDDPVYLESAIRQRPTIFHLGERALPLLLRFLSMPSGFRFMKELDFIDAQFDEWKDLGNMIYVIKMENNLARALWTWKIQPKTDEGASEEKAVESEGPSDSDCAILPHFYGELAKTAEGCALLKAKGHFADFARFIRLHGLKALEGIHLRKLKGYIWAVAHVGASRSGLTFLIEEDIIKHIVNIAFDTCILSLKGTCYYALALISTTYIGGKILGNLGWSSVWKDDGQPAGLCVPQDQSRFTQIPPVHYQGSWPDRRIKLAYFPLKFDTQEQEVLKQIGNMANHILANQASKALTKMRYETPALFGKVDLYVEVQRTLSCNHYRLTARRFIHDLFDKVAFSDVGLQRLDDIRGLFYDLRGTHWNASKDEQDEDETSELLMASGVASSHRRGINNGAIPAVKVQAIAKEEKIILKPLKSSRGFGIKN